MAGGNKLEILLSIKSEDSAIGKLQSKLKNILPSANKIEEKLSKLGNKINGSAFEKLRSKISSIIPSASSLSQKMNGLASKINGMKFNNFGNSLINGIEKIPLVGKKAASSLDKIRDKFNSFKSVGGGIGNVFNALKGKIKSAFPPGVLEKFKKGLNGIKEKVSGILGKLGSMVGKLGMVGSLVGGLSFAGIAKASDEASLRNSRLKMVTNDVGGLKQQTFNAAQSSGADYSSQLDQIAKLKMLTNGLFNDKEAVQFSSTLDKAFKVSGTSAEEASSAMYQLNQAMTSGKLQGDEFRSVMENAPILAQKIAESMGVSMGELKKLGSEGKITSDVIKKAVLGSSADIESKFKQMPITFATVWQQAKNAGQQAMDGVLNRVNQALNTQQGQQFAQSLQQGFQGLSQLADSSLTGIMNIFGKLNFAPLLAPLQGIGKTLSQAFSGLGGGEGLTNGIANGLNMIISLAGQVAGVIGQVLGSIDFSAIGQIFSDIGNAIGTFLSTLDFSSIGNAFAMAFQIVIQTVQMLTPVLSPIMQMFAVIVNLVIQIATALMPVIGIVLQIGAVLISAIVPVVQVIINAFVGIVSVIVGVFSAVIGVVSSVMSGILGVISGIINAIGGVVNRVVTFFSQAFNRAKSIAQGAINAIKGFIDGLFGKIGELGNKIASAVSKFNLFKGFGIGKNYTGTNYWRGGLTTVAERGAEMIRLPNGQQFLAGEEMLMNLPRGTQISNASDTQKMFETGISGIGKAISGRRTSTTSTTNNSKESKQISFSPTIIVENGSGNEENLVSRIKEVLNDFFNEKADLMGV